MKQWLKNLWEKTIGKSEKTEVSYTDISAIKDVVKNIVAVIVKAKQMKEDDGKISNSEWVMIGRSALPLVNDIRKWKVIKAQVLDFKTDEGLELAEYCVSLGILPSEVGGVVAHAIAAIEGSLQIYKNHIVPIVVSVKQMRKK